VNQPGPLFPRGLGRRRGPLVKPSARKAGAFDRWTVIAHGIATKRPRGAACSKPASASFSQKRAISLWNGVPVPFPSHIFQIADAAAFNSQRAPE